MKKGVRNGDLIFVRSGDGFTISQLYPNAANGKRFRISESLLTPEEVHGLGVDPETGDETDLTLRLRLTHGEDYWCLLLESVPGGDPVRSLGKVMDEVVSNIFYYRTEDGSPFMDLTYDKILRVRKAREDKEFRAKMLAHMDDTRAIRDILTEILSVIRKPEEPAAPKRRAPKRKPDEDAD